MAELVDAPDSKSGHLGGVGSIPSTPTKIDLYQILDLKKLTRGWPTYLESKKLLCTYGNVKDIKVRKI